MKAKMLCMVAALVFVFSMAAALIPAGPVMAAIHNIPDGDVAALRVAINTSNTNGVHDTINLAAGGTYTLNASDSDTDGPNGLPSINSSITINGNGATIQRDSAGGTPDFRIFHVAATGNVTMSGMTIRNGLADNGGGMTIRNGLADNGGGIWNKGTLTMRDCTVSGNEATISGGGIYTGQGIPNTLTMTDCTISGNKAGDDGGGIFSWDDATELTNCTISTNNASVGGGINYVANAAGTPLDLTNCTISGNKAEEIGGGLYIDTDDVATITNCTITNNTAEGEDSGGGIYHDNDEDELKLKLTCTIVYGNFADSDPNIWGLWTDMGENIVGDPVGDPDPLLGPLQDNGGPTETHALMTGSPAIDTCTTDCPLPATDQRGQPRAADGDIDGTYFCDVGAYERQVAVGGIVEPVDKIGILAPWLGLAALIIVVIPVIVLLKRKRVA